MKEAENDGLSLVNWNHYFCWLLNKKSIHSLWKLFKISKGIFSNSCLGVGLGGMLSCQRRLAGLGGGVVACGALVHGLVGGGGSIGASRLCPGTCVCAG